MKSPTSMTVAGISTRDLMASFVRRSFAITRQEGSLPLRFMSVYVAPVSALSLMRTILFFGYSSSLFSRWIRTESAEFLIISPRTTLPFVRTRLSGARKESSAACRPAP